MIEAVIFDMDGVILESEQFIREAEVETFKRFGIPTTIQLVSEYTGVRFDDEVKDIGRRFGVKIPMEEALDVQNKNKLHYYEEVVPPVPGIRETLETLKAIYALGLATANDKSISNSALQRLGLLSYFRAFTYREDFKKGKPDPEVFLRTAKLLRIDPSNCAIVEDSNPGFRAGKAAGMLVIARRADHNRDTDFSPADFIVEDVRKIPQILASQKL